MKTLLVSLYFTFFLFLNPSTIDNFSLIDGKMIWQKVYDTELSKEQIIKEIRNSSHFKNTSIHGENLTAEISELYLDYNGYGEKNVLARLNTRQIKSYVIIDFKKYKYRVTLKAIKLTPIATGGEFLDRTVDLEEYAIKKEGGVYRGRFLNKASKIMDFTFQKITDFKDTSDKEQW